MPKRGQPNDWGDLYARVKLVLPEPMTEQEVNTFRELVSRRSRQPA
jgi:curved DNA-binding protein